MKSFTKSITLAIVGLSLALPALPPTQANASAWHWGMAKKLRGTWRAHHDKIFHSHAKIGKNYYHFEANDPTFLNNTKFKYVGHHVYKINGYEPVYSKKRGNLYIKRISKHHIEVSNFKHVKKSNSISLYK